jgi:hypothetical protein
MVLSVIVAGENLIRHCPVTGDVSSSVSIVPVSGDCRSPKGRYTLVTLPRTVTPYRDSVDGTRDHVTYQ